MRYPQLWVGVAIAMLGFTGDGEARPARNNECRVLEAVALDIERSQRIPDESLEERTDAFEERRIVLGTDRCAQVRFYLVGSGSRPEERVRSYFRATFADGDKVEAETLEFDNDGKRRVRLGQEYRGVVCFGIRDLPITAIHCDGR